MTRADRRSPSGVLWPAVAGGAFFGPAVELLDVLGSDEPWDWGAVLVRGSVFAVVLGLVVALQVRLSAAARERAAVERAVATGVLPEGADGQWLVRLAAERQRLHTSRWGGPAVAAVLAALVGAVTPSPGGPGGWGWACVVVLLLGGGLVGVRSHRGLRAADRLGVELEERLARVRGRESGHDRRRRGDV